MYPTKRLSEICEILDRLRKPVTASDRVSGPYPYYGATGIQDYVDKHIFDEDLILVGEDGAKWGKGDNTAFKISGKTWVNNHAHVLRLDKNQIEENWIIYFMNYSDLSPYISGATVKKLNQEKLRSIEIPLPSLPIQSRIVAKLDEAFRNIDRQIDLLRINIRDVERLNSGLLEAILQEGDFELQTIEEITHGVQYGYTGKTKETGKYRLLRITDIQNNKIDWESVPFVEITDKEADKYKLNKGDIVFARTGATVGKSCLINDRGVGEIFASYLIRIIGNQGTMIPEFMQYFFYSSYYWGQIGEDVVGAAQPNFNGSKLKNIKIPVPSLEKQKEFILRLDDLSTKNMILRSEYESQIRDLEVLKQSLLEEAFAGRPAGE